MKLNQTGFTLIEKLIVLLTIVLLVAIAFPIYFSTRNKSAEMQCRANLWNIGVWYTTQYPRPTAAEIRRFIKEKKLKCPRGGVYNVPDRQIYLIGDFQNNEDILVWCPNHPHHTVQFKGQWGVIELNKKQPSPLFLSLTREGKVGYYPILKEADQR